LVPCGKLSAVCFYLGKIPMFENVELVYSPLNRVIAKDGLEIEICIYKGGHLIQAGALRL